MTMPRCPRTALPGFAMLVALATAPLALKAQDTDGRFALQQLPGGVRVLMPNEGSGNGILLGTSDGTLLVDTPADTIADAFMTALDRLGMPPVRWVVNTHWHRNHAGANDRFRDGAVLIAPTTLRERSMVEQTLPFLTGESYAPLPPSGWQTLTFGDSITLHLGSETVRIWHVRGHTDTDAIVWMVQAGVVATGDLWVPNGIISPDIDTGGSIRGIVSALDDLLERIPDDVTIQPGHGPAGTRADLVRYRDGMRGLLDHAERLRRRGMNADQAAAAPIPSDVTAFAGRSAPRLIRAAVLAP